MGELETEKKTSLLARELWIPAIQAGQHACPGVIGFLGPHVAILCTLILTQMLTQ